MQQEKITPTRATKWFNTREWAKGLKLEPHKSTDILEFYYHYAKNPGYWNDAFTWLRDTNLNETAPGKHMINGDRVFVAVSDGPTRNLEETKWEAHRKYIDIQYVVRGKEKIGVAPLSKAVETSAFDQAKDIGFYEVPEPDCRFYLAEPGTFFIFFPNDAHRPGISVRGTDSVKKIVIKVKI
jgi:YhcH/YjgK/YiaL family protein